MLDNAFVYYYKGKNEVYNLIESKRYPWPLSSLFLGLNKMGIKICQFLTTLTILTLIILYSEMLKFSKFILLFNRHLSKLSRYYNSQILI